MRYAYFDSEITGVDEHGMPIFDRAENSEMFAMIFAKLLTNGVLAQPGDCFQVVASGSGMNISVRPGFAMIKGRFAYEEEATNLEIEAAPKQYSRIDRVVLRCNYLERLIELVVKTGTSGASPVAPELEQPASGDYYELGLATVRVSANQTVLSQSAITDTRGDSSVCGYVAQLIDHLDTEEFYKQLNSFYSEFVDKTDQNYAAFEEKTKSAFDKYTSDLNDYIDSMERNGSSALTGLVNSLSKFRSDAQTEFNQWFANVQGQLGEDAAGNLMNTANDHETRLDSLENMVLTNNFTAPIDTGDSNVLVDEEGNAIVADWQFMEKTTGTTNNSNKGSSENPYEPSENTWVDAVTTGLVRYYIDGLNGDDSNTGTREAPFKTLDPVYKIMNQGHCNLRIALAGGSTYEFKAFTLANTHIHFSLWGTGEPILKFVPVYSTDPTKTPDEFAFYNCHINCKGVYDEKTKTTRYFRVQCSTNKMYFESGNLALTYAKIEKVRISFYQSGGLILNSSIDAVRSIGSNVRMANSIIGAIDSYASVIGIEGCTIYANRTTEHASSAFWHLSGGNFYLQGGTTINGTPGVANFISAFNAMIGIASAIGSGTSFKQFSGSITIQCGMMSITQAQYNALKALAKTTSINLDKTKPDVLLITGINV